MIPITILETGYATLQFHPEHKIVHHTIHKFIYGSEFRHVLEKGLELFREYGAQKWLSDDRNSSALPQSDLDWGTVNWLPGMMKSGWKFWAIVLPEKAVGQAHMRRAIDQYARLGVTVKIFDDPVEALKWLEVIQV